MTVSLTEITATLARTPGTLDALLRGLDACWTGLTEGEATWSPREVLGHLLDAERSNWLPRLQTMLDGDGRFPPFDRFAHLDTQGARTADELLGAFAQERRRSLEVLRALHLTPAALERTGQHPEFGTVTAGQLLATWATHDLDHTVQITRTLAGGYRDAVGPWQAYLRVLRPER